MHQVRAAGRLELFNQFRVERLKPIRCECDSAAATRALAALLEYVGKGELINRVVEISLGGQNTLIQECEIPSSRP
jgi:hypothetical protein